jgi:hypothetical protein
VIGSRVAPTSCCSPHRLQNTKLGALWTEGPYPTRRESPEPVEIVRGINEHGNEWTRVTYDDEGNEWWYHNLSGTYYKKNRDGSADFVCPGFTKHYPTPISDRQVRREEHDRVDARDVSPGYPVPSQNVPATRREDIQQPELVNSTENRIKVGRKRRRQPQPPANRYTTPSPSRSDSPPPSTSQSLSARSKAKHKLKTSQTTKTRKQESPNIHYAF